MILAMSAGIVASCQAAPQRPESTPIPTPAPSSTPSRAPEPQLLSAAANICQSAWRLPTKVHPERVSSTGSTLTLIVDADEPNGEWTWAGEQFDLPDMENATAPDLQSVICIVESLTQEGIFIETGQRATSRNWMVRLLSWPDGLVVNETFLSSPAPLRIEVGQSSVGVAPLEELFSWVTNPPGGRAIQVWHAENPAPIQAARVSPDGSLLAIGLEDGTLKLLDFATGEEIRTLNRDEPLGGFPGERRWGYFGFSTDGKTLFSRSPTKIAAWDVASGQERQTLPMPYQEGDAYGLPDIRFMPDGRILALTTSEQGVIKLWDVAAGNELSMVNLPADFDPTRKWLAQLSPDAATLATVIGENGIVKLWDMSTGVELRELKSPTDRSIVFVRFSPDSAILALHEGSHDVSLWEVATGKATAAIRDGDFDFHGRESFSPNGQWLVACDQSRDNTLKAWDSATGNEVLTTRTGGCLWDFWPDKATLAILNESDDPQFWNVATGETVRTLQMLPQLNTIVGTVFLPDSKSVAMWDSFGRLELWDVKAND